MMRFLQTLRYLFRQRSFSTTVMLTLAVGIGATAAIFSVVNAVLLEPLPYPQSDRLIELRHRMENTGARSERRDANVGSRAAARPA